MLVTITNVSSDKVYVSMLYNSIDPGSSETTSRTSAQIEAELQLRDLVLDGLVTLSFIAEPGDGVISSPELLPNYTNATLPDASTFAEGTMVWNSDDNAPVYSDGSAWRDADGNLT